MTNLNMFNGMSFSYGHFSAFTTPANSHSGYYLTYYLISLPHNQSITRASYAATHCMYGIMFIDD